MPRPLARDPEGETHEAQGDPLSGLFLTLPASRRGLLPYWFRSQARGIGIGLLACLMVWLILGGLSPAGLAGSILVTLVYSLSIGGLLAASLPLLPRRIRDVPSARNGLVFLALSLSLSALGSGLAGLVLFATGVFEPARFWDDFYFVSRIAVFFTVVFVSLAYGYSSMRIRLEAQIERGSHELRTQRKEFAAAREIQVNLLPRELPVLRGYGLAGAWQPARVVGGDYFDVLSLDAGRVALCVGDVVGKGVSAALLMANLQAAVKAFAGIARSAADLCERVNRVIADNIAPGKFITFFYGVLDLRSRRLEYCRAGHNPPLLLRGGGSVRLTEGGPVLGLLPVPGYEQGQAELCPGDLVLLYTDGLTEATDAEDQEFGEARLLDVARTHARQGADRVRVAILDAVTSFAGGQFQDDATLLVLSVE